MSNAYLMSVSYKIRIHYIIFLRTLPLIQLVRGSTYFPALGHRHSKQKLVNKNSHCRPVWLLSPNILCCFISFWLSWCKSLESWLMAKSSLIHFELLKYRPFSRNHINLFINAGFFFVCSDQINDSVQQVVNFIVPIEIWVYYRQMSSKTFKDLTGSTNNNVTRVPDITEQALAVKDFHYLSRMKPFWRFYLHRQKNANGSKFALFL